MLDGPLSWDKGNGSLIQFSGASFCLSLVIEGAILFDSTGGGSVADEPLADLL